MIKVDLSGLLPAVQSELDAALQRVSIAVQNSARLVENEWRHAVFNAKGLSPVEREAYLDSLSVHVTGPFAAEIVADYSLASQIETGRPAYDMKKVLQTSQRTRISKSGPHQGQKYLIIPFRHNVPGNNAHAPSMPPQVYKKAKYLSKSSIAGSGSRISGTGHLVSQSSYKWGGRLPAGILGPNPKGKSDRYAGMVRMNTSAGGAKSSAYLTFRVMAESSSGWIMPAKPGLKIAEGVENKLAPVIKEIIEQAAKG